MSELDREISELLLKSGETKAKAKRKKQRTGNRKHFRYSRT